jgi:microcystin-dependent protein
MTDQLGPDDGLNAVTTRPSDSTSFSATDMWFAPCSSPTAQDGTQVTANFLNRVLANLRSVWRGAGNLISSSPVNPDTYSDSGLLNAILQLIQRGQTSFAVDAGTVNALVVNPTPALKEYKAGIPLRVQIANAVTGASQINVSGLGAVSLAWADGSALAAGDWPAGAIGDLVCTGAAWALKSVAGPTVFMRANSGVAACPPGMVSFFTATTAPSGWLAASGQLVSRTTYANLWTYAQASGNLAASDGAWLPGQYSPGDGATTFRIPNLQGVFIRGYDSAATLDTDRAGAFGTYQADAFKAHTHSSSGISAGGSAGTLIGQGTVITNAGATIGSTGGTETRPKNVNMLACVKT